MLSEKLIDQVSFDWLVYLWCFNGVEISLEQSVLVIKLSSSLVDGSKFLQQGMNSHLVPAVNGDHIVDVRWLITLDIHVDVDLLFILLGLLLESMNSLLLHS